MFNRQLNLRLQSSHSAISGSMLQVIKEARDNFSKVSQQLVSRGALVGNSPFFAPGDPEVGAARADFRAALHEAGVAPEAELTAYRVGDSPPNVVTPLMPYCANRHLRAAL